MTFVMMKNEIGIIQIRGGTLLLTSINTPYVYYT